MTTPHPADTAKPGDAFRDENGATWLLARNRATWCYPWLTLSGHTALWHTSTDAHEHTLTRLVPEGDGVVDAEVIDVSDPAQLRRAADVIDGISGLDPDGAYAWVSKQLRTKAERLGADAADRALAEQIAGDVWKGVGPTPSTLDDAITEAVLAGIRAGRDAEAG